MTSILTPSAVHFDNNTVGNWMSLSQFKKAYPGRETYFYLQNVYDPPTLCAESFGGFVDGLSGVVKMTKARRQSYMVELFYDVDPETVEDGYDNSAGNSVFKAHGVEFDISGNGHEYTLWFETKEEADMLVSKVIEIRRARREANVLIRETNENRKARREVKKLAIEKDAAIDLAYDLKYAAEHPNPKITTAINLEAID